MNKTVYDIIITYGTAAAVSSTVVEEHSCMARVHMYNCQLFFCVANMICIIIMVLLYNSRPYFAYFIIYYCIFMQTAMQQIFYFILHFILCICSIYLQFHFCKSRSKRGIVREGSAAACQQKSLCLITDARPRAVSFIFNRPVEL